MFNNAKIDRKSEIVSIIFITRNYYKQNSKLTQISLAIRKRIRYNIKANLQGKEVYIICQKYVQ